MISKIRSLLLFLLFTAICLPLSQTIATAHPQFFFQVNEGVDEDDAEFMDNPWRVDERKLFAAKKFQLSNQFALKVRQIENVCGELDKKQKLKLSVAAKGATEQALKKFAKSWEDQLKQFGGQFGNNDDDDDKKKKDKKRKKKKKKFVVKSVDQIDAQVMQLLDTANFGGVQKQNYGDVALWRRTVKKVLNEEQRKKLDAHIENMKLGKRNARADSFLSDMRFKLALAEDQIEEFDKIVRPAFLERDIEVSWNYEAMVTLYLGSKYDKQKMKKLLSEEQLLELRIAVKAAENYGGMFGDNNNAVVAVGGVAIADAPILGFLDEMLDAVEDLAEIVQQPLEELFKW